MFHKRALLIGNGINQLDPKQSVSWGDLLDQLKQDFDIQVDLNNPFKPFPLGFEEMLHRKGGNDAFISKLRHLKQAIRENIDQQLDGKPGFNEYHKKIMRLGYQDVLTTNYDYALEKSVIRDFVDRKASLAVNKQESKFSLKRAYHLPDLATKVWHIHGELCDSRNLQDTSKYYHEESIMIGYEHYASYLEKIQDNYNGQRRSRRPEHRGLLSRIKNGTSGRYWSDIFFTHDMDIIGQGLDFSENHLWWLLNQRANLKRSAGQHEVQIENRIRFYYPILPKTELSENDDLETLIWRRNATDKARGIGEVLEAFMVEARGVECEDYWDFYERVVEKLIVG